MSDGNTGADGSEATFVTSLAERLVDEFAMTDYVAKLLADGLAKSDDAVREQAQRWLEDGTVPDLEGDGTSVGSALSDGLAPDPLSALLLIGDLRRDPERTRRIIRRGKDEIRRPLGRKHRAGAGPDSDPGAASSDS